MILPLLAGAGILWLLYSKPSTPTTTTAPPPPPSNTDILRRNVADLLRAADAAPLLMNPDAMDLAAVQLDSAGLAAEAAAVRAKAAQVRVAQGPLVSPPPFVPGVENPPPRPAADVPVTQPQAPVPSGATPSALPSDLSAQVDAVLANPEASPIAVFVLLDEFERRFRPGSFGDKVAQLQAAARALKAKSPPASLNDALALLRLANTNPERVSPAFMDAIAADIAVTNKLTSDGLRTRAKVMREQGLGMRIPGVAASPPSAAPRARAGGNLPPGMR